MSVALLKLRNETVACSDVGDETVVLDLSSSTYFTVKGSGTFLLKQLADGTTAESMTQYLIDNYDVDYATARGDVDTFIEQLTASNLLDHGEAP